MTEHEVMAAHAYLVEGASGVLAVLVAYLLWAVLLIFVSGWFLSRVASSEERGKAPNA